MWAVQLHAQSCAEHTRWSAVERLWRGGPATQQQGFTPVDDWGGYCPGGDLSVELAGDWDKSHCLELVHLRLTALFDPCMLKNLGRCLFPVGKWGKKSGGFRLIPALVPTQPAGWLLLGQLGSLGTLTTKHAAAIQRQCFMGGRMV
jgi:hypothetical protein